MLKRCLAAMAAAIALLVPASPVSAETARPALWKLSDSDTTIYLFGTVHALPDKLQWQGGTVARAFASARTLVVEIANGDQDEKAFQPMLALGMAEPGSVPPLVDRVPPENRKALKNTIEKSGYPPQSLDRFKTWLAAIILAMPAIKDAGLDPKSGADRQLMKRARARHVPIKGLETFEQQLGYFNALPEAEQRKLLKAVIEDDGQTRQEYAKLIGAWAKGDVSQIEQLADDELKASPTLRTALLTRRNARWTDWLAQRMKAPGTVFVAVGAGHLAGTDSLQAMLSARGFKVRRLQ